MSDFTPFEDRLTALIAALSPAGRRRLTTEIAKTVRQQQQQRIKSQTAPDGTPYTPRKRQPVRGKKNRVKREMFAKLRTNRYMKASGDDSAAAVEFTGKVQRIVRVHQFGLKDRPSLYGQEVSYHERQLLGFSQEDYQNIEELIIEKLS